MSDGAGPRGPLRIAIIGAGPAGSALAIFLARQHADVTLFDDGRHPELLVGESLVPAVVPILRRLGIEEETAAFSRVKPGVSFIWSPTDRFSVTFDRFAPAVFPYAYNIPRPRFDEALLARAIASGVRHVHGESPAASGDRAADETRSWPSRPRRWRRHRHSMGTRRTSSSTPPDGPGYVARALAIPARLGPRKDVAHFAHFEGSHWDDAPGQVLIARGKAGWSWCIPLQERLSIGVVLGQDDAARLGRTPEERLERAIATDPWLSTIARDARRVTSVATYSNYQLVSERGYGRGWAMVGDAFGFIDPMLSPGVFLALHSAELLADALAPWLKRRTVPSPAEMDSAMASYADRQTAMLSAWLELVAYLYDGRLAALMRAGQSWVTPGSGFLKKSAEQHIARHVGLLASGAATTSRYSRGLLRFLSHHRLRGVDPKGFAIR